MNKQKTINFLKNNHKKLERVISGLKKSQMVEEIITGKWTTKDILAHISAWNLELTKATDDLLNDVKPWFIDEEEITEAEFNEIETKKRKSLSFDQVLDEWQNSFSKLIQKVEKLSTSELEYQTPFEWAKNVPVTVNSLFEYIYRGEGHEGGHAKQIGEYFRTKE